MGLPLYPDRATAIEESMSKSKNQTKSKNHAQVTPSKAPQSQTTPSKATPSKAAPPKATMQTKRANQRNTLLTIALVLVILHAILVVGLFWFGAPEAQRTLGSIALWLTGLSAIADIVAAIAMWYWKQWGLYLFGIATIAGAVGALLATGSMLFLFGALLPAIIVLYIVAMQRNKFE
jgi:hypothetical protein